MKPPFWVIGHRGSPVREVENTMASFAAALDDGANAVEADVSLTRDQGAVLWHDWDPNSCRSFARVIGIEPWVRCKPVIPFGRHRKRASALTLSELREHYGYAEKRLAGARLDVRVPTLADFFEWAMGEPRLARVFLDIKIPASEFELVSVLLNEVDSLVNRMRPRFGVVLETSELAILAELRRLGSRHPACFDVEPRPGFVLDSGGYSAVERAIEHGAHIAGPQRPRPLTVLPFLTHARIVERELARQHLHNAESPRVPLEGVVSFTINDEREMASLMRLGVAGIQSDLPALLRAVAERLGKIAGWLAEPVVARSASGA